jgi:hypothetical protein
VDGALTPSISSWMSAAMAIHGAMGPGRPSVEGGRPSFVCRQMTKPLALEEYGSVLMRRWERGGRESWTGGRQIVEGRGT